MVTAPKATVFGILLAFAVAARGEPAVDFDPFSVSARYRSECGNPAYESMLWQVVSGNVVEVPDGHTLVFAVDGNRGKRTIGLVAIQPPDIALAENEAGRKILEELSLGKHASVWVNPSIDLSASPDAELIGVVYVAGTDINLRMLELGLASFQQPKPYSMSNFVACTYRMVEKTAKNKGLGIWKGSTRPVSN